VCKLRSPSIKKLLILPTFANVWPAGVAYYLSTGSCKNHEVVFAASIGPVDSGVEQDGARVVR
jgi:hypothetical protein